jgi:hypothetical protein
MIDLAIIRDVISGPALVVGGTVALVATLVVAFVSETIVLLVMRWAPLLRSARDALVVNAASGLTGIVLAVVLWNVIADDVPPEAIAVGSWALSVAIEGALLRWLGGEQPAWKPWAAALVMNVVSYGLIFGLGLALDSL